LIDELALLSFYDSLNAPNCHGHSFSCSCTALWNNYDYFHDFGTNCMVPSDWDSAPRRVCRPNFTSDLIGKSPNFSAAARVPGLPTRHCARSCNNRAQMFAQLSAIDVTEKTFFERLYLVLGLQRFALCVSCPCAPTSPTIQCTTICRFL